VEAPGIVPLLIGLRDTLHRPKTVLVCTGKHQAAAIASLHTQSSPIGLTEHGVSLSYTPPTQFIRLRVSIDYGRLLQTVIFSLGASFASLKV